MSNNLTKEQWIKVLKKSKRLKKQLEDKQWHPALKDNDRNTLLNIIDYFIKNVY